MESWPDEEFRAEVRTWLADNLSGEFAPLVGMGGPGREHELVPERLAWERRLGEGGWIGLGWPEADGGRALSWEHQVIFHEEYARAGGPGRVGHIGEQLVGPTLLAFGTPGQKARFLPGILAGTQLWCQGYSEPGAGSDLAAVQTRAALRDGEWHVDGQKVWTSHARHADWCFVLARTEPGSSRHRGLSYLLVPMRQPGVEVRPIVQLTGTSEFNEVFFDDAVTAGSNVVGRPGDGWKVAMGTLAVERGVSTFGQQLGFQRELDSVVASARANGAIDDPDIAARIVDAWAGLRVLRYTAQGTLGLQARGVADPGGAANIAKLLWANWHRGLGELAVDVAGPDATLAGEDYDLSDEQRLFLFTRADTIYGGSNEIQRNVIAERLLGLPRSSGGRPPQTPSKSNPREIPGGTVTVDFTAVTDTPEQADLRAVLRDFVTRRGTPERVRQAIASPAGYDETAWKRLTGELGLTALAVPETRGGAGATLAEVAVAVEELGRVLLPVPYLPTALTAALLAEAATAPAPASSRAACVPVPAASAVQAADRFLPGLAEGSLIGALAFGPGVTTFSGGRLSGTVRHVLDGPRADVFLVRVSGALVAARAADATVSPVGTLDQTRRQATVSFRDTPALRLSPDDDAGAFASRAEDLARALLAAESAAAAGQCLAATVEYLKTRVQFGRPIGEFQALKHRCADLAVEVESARMTAHAAVRAAVSDPGEFAVAAPLAKRYCADVFFHAAAEMIQLHGGIGFTWEHDAHLFLKRAKTTQLLHGTPSNLRTLTARRAGLLSLNRTRFAAGRIPRWRRCQSVVMSCGQRAGPVPGRCAGRADTPSCRRWQDSA